MTPINLRPHEVRAYLAGTKTEFRRVMKPQPPEGSELQVGVFATTKGMLRGEAQPNGKTCWAYTTDGEWGVKSPFGGPGNVLYGREAFQVCDLVYDGYYGGYEAGYPLDKIPKEQPSMFTVFYAADGDDGPWRSPMHMPQWAARVWLEVVSVRAERVQAIGSDGRKAASVKAEGIEQATIDQWGEWFHQDNAPALAFSEQFDRDNGKGAWQANPFVWVYSVKPTHPPGR